METGPTRATANNDKDLFVSVLGKLLRPIADEVVNEVIGDNEPTQAELEATQDLVGEVHQKILSRLYDLAQKETMLSMALIPLMAHIKKIPVAKEKTN